MNRDLFVHAGLHKTGTTYLQEHVFPRMSKGTYILGTKRPVYRFINEFSKATPPILWSQESLSGIRDVGQYKESQRRMLKFVSSTFPGAGLILFLREPAQIIQSFYIQYIHEGGAGSFTEWFEEYEDAFDYINLLEDISSMGWDEVLLFDHDQLRSDPEFVISTMERFVGCQFSGWRETRGRVSNRSVSKLGARGLRYANRFMVSSRNPDGSPFISRIAKSLRINPRWHFKDGALRGLSKVGKPLLDHDTITGLQKRYGPSWHLTLEKIIENQNRWQDVRPSNPASGEGD